MVINVSFDDEEMEEAAATSSAIATVGQCGNALITKSSSLSREEVDWDLLDKEAREEENLAGVKKEEVKGSTSFSSPRDDDTTMMVAKQPTTTSAALWEEPYM